MSEVEGGKLRSIRARALVLDAERSIDDGAVIVDGEAIVAVGPAAGLWDTVSPTDRIDLGDVVLAPGLIDAHAHLELSALEGCSERGAKFERWVGDLLASRVATPESTLLGARDRVAGDLLDSGTTIVGDIDSLGLDPLVAPGPERLVYRELLDARDPKRTEGEMEKIVRAVEESGPEWIGLSPHAPFSVSDALLASIAEKASRLPRAMHWAETEEEVRWFDGDPGWFDRFFPRDSTMHGLDALERHGLLDARTALVHGNHPRPGEPERIARAGATVVHCPGSHAYFDRAPFPLDLYRDAGVTLALGTDSAASNDGVDMRREMARFLDTQPGVSPAEVWRAATAGGAAALGLKGRVGVIERGFRADFAAFRCAAPAGAALLEQLVAGIPAVESVWLRGRCVRHRA
ncbi:MAG: amidohydrolase family protein [Planctomycetota bacterium]|jgi:cytosine/adenosine deaminase-related metal-dependent hydrolase